MSYLDMVEVIQTTPLISKQWRYLWKSLPTLNFNTYLWVYGPRNYYKGAGDFLDITNGFTDFVDSVFHFRDNNSNLDKFSIEGRIYDSGERFSNCLISAIKKNVQEVYLSFWKFSCLPIEFPHSLFSSTIKVFHLDSIEENQIWSLPNTMCIASHLKSLRLRSVILPKGDSKRELVLSCPILETLVLRDCDHGHLDSFIISTVQLKNLVVENSSWANNESCRININTPNLQVLNCIGSMYKDYVLENLPSLVTVNIGSGEMHAYCLVNVLKELYNATTLTISVWQSLVDVQDLLVSPDMLDQLPNQFYNLKYLKLASWHSHCIGAIAKLLQISPYIESLVWEIRKGYYFSLEERKYDEHLFSECKFDHLKFIEIKNLKVCKEEFKLLKVLLGKGIVLESIVITPSLVTSQRKQKNLEEFMEKLQSLPRASSSMTISFLRSQN
ncbi:hypothetical protein FRX31_026047 [Thalictrum thalictroides]|uniref:FBD domain-containing protein n=1 Tax=Thalictrum thalictroides TaxID=46969 RepID=A0A7J6VHX6_THATH|nr:hypothetical protein FRX31_026047 [Thalictrum thalictroides]